MMIKKYKHLLSILKELNSVVLAFSGGIDSTFLLYSCLKVLPFSNITPITIKSAFLSESECKNIFYILDYFNVRCKLLEVNVFSHQFIVNNSYNRCYYCKKLFFSKITDEAKKIRVSNIIEGSNLDDLSDYRPGLKALDELNIKSPLIYANITKNDIRTLSKKFNIPNWNKPSMACLASRIPYKTKITKNKLTQIEESEKILEEYGFNSFRVRHHNSIARIELETGEWQKFLKSKNIVEDIVKKIKKIGFEYITLDLKGYSQGSLNPKMPNN